MINEKYLNEITKTKFFNHLNESEILSLFSDIDYNIKKYDKGNIIFYEGEICDNLSIIIKGVIEIEKVNSEGKVLTIAQFSHGETFGENLIFGDINLFPINVISKTNTTILHIKKDSVIKLCQEDTQFLYSFLNALSNKALKLNTRLKEVSLKTIRQQICTFLLEEYNIQKNKRIKLEMSKKDWADILGVQRPSLSRELKKMKEENLIDYDNNTITVLDVEGLKYFN